MWRRSRGCRLGTINWVLLLAFVAACAPDPPEARDLPPEWYPATIEPLRGGRYVPAANRSLTEFQDRVLASRVPIPYPHYADSGTIVVAIKSDFIDSGTRRRLAVLLEHEASDPSLSVVAFTDESTEEIDRALALEGSERIDLVPAAGEGRHHVTFQFLRDYAPLVRVVPTDDGFETEGFVLFRGSTLNKVVDARLGVRINRAEKTTREKASLGRELMELYRERLRRSVSVRELSLRMDGGNVVTDGRGSCFATQILVAKNGGDRPRVERELREQAGCQRTLFLAAPQRLDFIQHVDTLLYFADAQNVVLSMPTHYESDKIHEFQNVRKLLELGYRVHRVPRPTASITYTNILTTRRNVYVPQYSRYKVESGGQLARNEAVAAYQRAERRDLAAWYLSLPGETRIVEGGQELAIANQHALDVISRLLPDKRVVPVASDETLETQGSWHCLSHELPEPL